MKRLIALMAALYAAPALAQTPAPAAPGAPDPVTVAGTLTSGVQLTDNSSNSSKLTEYRDLRDDFFLPAIAFGANDPGTGWFFDLRGSNVSRRDQFIAAEAGRPGIFSIGVVWNEIPHDLSNKAVTPYINRGGGLLTVPASVPITFKKLATAAADAPGVVASDSLVAAFQSEFLAPVDLATQTRHGRFALDWSGADVIGLSVAYDRREKTGSKSGFGPIGDRPPRTLNIQLAEPVDYLTHDLAFAAEHDGGRFQVRGEYRYSDFANGIDTMTWENVYSTAMPGSTYDVWDRAVSVAGRRPLPPDNRYHNLSASFGANLPFDSRLTATGVYGRMEQNQSLLPYSFHDDVLVTRTLPRTTAEAEIVFTQWLADYVVTPMPRLNLRAWARHYGMDNNTPESNWTYVTSDTSNLNGTVSYKNRRVSLAYATDRTNAGVDATYRMPGRSTLTVGFEREDVSRDYREADTGENRVTAAVRLRPANRITLRARYLFGTRDGGTYDATVTRQSYWYQLADAGADNDNPRFTFSNHPDMRRYDVSDRERQQVDMTLNLTPRDAVAVSAYVRYRKDDFDSGVAPSQPLSGTTLADRSASTPGDQLGWLEDTRLRYGVDLFVQPGPRVSVNAFLNYDQGTSVERSLEYNENNKQNPSAVATAELGPWTRPGSQWTADFDDRTWSGGLGTVLQLVPGRLTLLADYTLSLADVDTTYAGFGVTNWDGTPFPPIHQFAFSTPPTTRENLHVVNVRLEIPVRIFTAVLGYSYESYTLEDWQEGGFGHWVEAVGADTLLRDTSRSHQWGNRLFNLGTYLAPGYDAHIGFIGLTYRF